MASYLDNPGAVAALVRDDEVHRDVYTSPAIYALEMRHVWSRAWVYVGHESQIAEPGDYITVDLAGQPVILIRHADRTVHVLYNRCAHKGTRLLSQACGNTGRFLRCPYHAWSYRTDGSLIGIPLEASYDGTRFADCTAAKGMARVANVESYRGFVFARLSADGPGFEAFFGASLTSIDNMVDRAPDGELILAGGALRYLHNCNWKMFIENLNDTMHPMVAHESSAGTAKMLWKDKPVDEPRPMAIEQFVPFASDYQFFDDMGVRVFANGHSYTGVNFSIHSKYSAVPEYEAALVARHGEERAHAILREARHNTVYYPSLTIKGAIQAIRVVRPLGPDRTIIESYTFRLKGAPAPLHQRTMTYSRLINSPMSVVGHDDLHAYRSMQEGLACGGNEWVSLHRDFDPAEIGAAERTVRGTSEISMRNQFRAWQQLMVDGMRSDALACAGLAPGSAAAAPAPASAGAIQP